MDPMDYWNRRYRKGGTSGAGSQGEEVEAKARHINEFIVKEGITSVVDWGCGDGELLRRLNLEGVTYTGVDLSAETIARVVPRYPRLNFVRMDTREGPSISIGAELSLSIDTIFHLPDDVAYRRYLAYLFGSATRYVLIHSPNRDEDKHGHHLRYRRFTQDIRFAPWSIQDAPRSDDKPGFYLYRKY